MFDIIERNLLLLQEQSGQDGSLARLVESAIIQKLSLGPPCVDTIATVLGRSPRALQRELTAHSLKFNELLDKARYDLATRMLTTTGHSLSEITYLLEYPEESAFILAFRRWMGCTPLDYRRSMRNPATQGG